MRKFGPKPAKVNVVGDRSFAQGIRQIELETDAYGIELAKCEIRRNTSKFFTVHEEDISPYKEGSGTELSGDFLFQLDWADIPSINAAKKEKDN